MPSERKRIGLREVRALLPDGTIWDTDVGGFHARRREGPTVTYYVMYRTTSAIQRRHRIGRHGSPWTPDEARDEAKRLLGEVVQGIDPAAERKASRKAETVNQLLDLYWEDAEAGHLLTRRGAPKKATTLLSDKGRIDKHIRPLLGAMKVKGVGRADIEAFIRDVAGGKTAAREPTGRKRGLSNVRGGAGTAKRTAGLLSGIFAYAVSHGMRADNPVHGVRRRAYGRRERRLSDVEYAALGQALREAAAKNFWPPAVAAVRFLALTGWRAGEVLGLTHAEVDLTRRTATLPDTKTGRSIRPLSHEACNVLRAMPRIGDGELVFPASRGEGQMSGFRSIWDRIAKLAALPADVTPHVARHSFASLAADLGYSEIAIAALIGHKGHSITSRYVHTADTVLLAAADVIARRTLELMGDVRPAEVIELHPAAARA